MKRPTVTTTMSQSGAVRLHIASSSLEIVATKRWDRWDVEIITPGPFAVGLGENAARDVLLALADLHQRALTAARTTAPAPRVDCHFCQRSVAIVRGLLAWHNEKEPGHGVESKLCRGYGAAPQVPL